MDAVTGISCVLVNTVRGADIASRAGLLSVVSNYESIVKENRQLYQASERPDDRSEFLSIYETGGYVAVEKAFNQKLGIKKYAILIRNRIPPQIRLKLRMLLGK